MSRTARSPAAAGCQPSLWRSTVTVRARSRPARRGRWVRLKEGAAAGASTWRSAPWAAQTSASAGRGRRGLRRWCRRWRRRGAGRGCRSGRRGGRRGRGRPGGWGRRRGRGGRGARRRAGRSGGRWRRRRCGGAFPGAAVPGVALPGGVLSGAVLSGVVLSGAAFTGEAFSGVVFPGEEEGELVGLGAAGGDEGVGAGAPGWISAARAVVTRASRAEAAGPGPRESMEGLSAEAARSAAAASARAGCGGGRRRAGRRGRRRRRRGRGRGCGGLRRGRFRSRGVRLRAVRCGGPPPPVPSREGPARSSAPARRASRTVPRRGRRASAPGMPPARVGVRHAWTTGCRGARGFVRRVRGVTRTGDTGWCFEDGRCGDRRPVPAPWRLSPP